MANQKSYLCTNIVRGWTGQVPSITAVSGIDSITNPEGIFDPDTSNYTTLITSEHDNTVVFDVTFSFNRHFSQASTLCFGLIAIGAPSFPGSGGAVCPSYSYRFESTAGWGNFNAQEGVSVAHVRDWNSAGTPSNAKNYSLSGSGGATMLSHEHPRPLTSTGNVTIRCTVTMEMFGEEAVIRIGRMFLGNEIPLHIDPSTFSLNVDTDQDRFTTRSRGFVNSPASLATTCSLTANLVGLERIIGRDYFAAPPSSDGSIVPQLMSAVYANAGDPMVLSPYPSVSKSADTGESRMLSARQNAFSLHGLLDSPLRITVPHFKDGVDTQYQAHLSMREYR